MIMKNVNSLAELRAEIHRARADRDRVQEELRQRMAVLNDPRTRGILLRDAAGDALRTWKPFRLVHEALHGKVSGETVASAGMAAASLQGTWKKRILWSGASWLLGQVIGDDPLKRASILGTIGGALSKAREALKPARPAHDGRQAR
ncbi:MAG: hypothetical protein IPJ76_07515 [Flavobacteriales bacterium]|nr:MAG: hypothetical protein IPJ76_07515 [Flavobacteriales bacterium]